MDFLILIFFFTYVCSFNNITYINYPNLKGKIIDIYFEKDEIYFLQKDSILKGNSNTSNYSINEYSFQNSEIMNSNSGFSKTDKRFFIACSNKYFISYYKLINDSLILENKVDYIFKDDKNKIYNLINSPLFNCTISIVNEYVIVSYISEINNSSLFIFKINDINLSFKYLKNYIDENSLSKSYEDLKGVLINCFNLDNSQSNIICVYFYRQFHSFKLNNGEENYNNIIMEKYSFESFFQEKIYQIIKKNNYLHIINKKNNNEFLKKKKRKCDEKNCKDDNLYYNEETGVCVENCSNASLLLENEKKCVIKCPKEKPYYDLEKMECMTECQKNYTFIINEVNECVKSCNETYPFKIKGKNKCYSECPDNYYNEEGETECREYCLSEVVSNKSISCTNDEIYNINKYNIELDDQCREALNSNKKEIKIKKTILIQDNNVVDLLKYSFYEIKDKNLSKTDLSECEGNTIFITTPVKQDILDIYNKILLTWKKGYDIFKSNDSFYNDYCSKFSDVNNTDVPIKLRREYYFQELSLCEEDCNFNKFNYADMTITCTCEYKIANRKNRDELKFKQADNNFKKIKKYNFETLKCNILKNLNKNIGHWIIFSGVYTQVILFFVFVLYQKGINYIFQKNFPSSIDNSKKDNNNNNHNNDANNFQVLDFLSQSQNNVNESSKNGELSDEDITTHEGLNDLDYKFAKKHDIRDFNEYFWFNLQYIQMLLFIIYKDKFNVLEVKISLFVNIITFSFFFNMLLFGNGLIEIKYKNNGVLPLKNSLGIIILSSILTVLLNCIAKIFWLTKSDVKSTKEKIKNNDKQGLNQLEKTIKRKTIIYFIIIFFFTLLIWYFVTAFCAVYTQCQKNLFFNAFMSCLIIMIYPIPLCYVITKCRFEGIKKENENLFFIGHLLQKIIMY